MLNRGDWLSCGDGGIYILERMCRGSWDFTYIVIAWSENHKVATLRTMFHEDVVEYYQRENDECWWLADAYEYLSKQRS